MTVLFVGLSAVLLFRGLGAHALWDDEANTALFGEGVWQTGDTVGLRGGNVVAFRNGVELDGQLKNRMTSPLGFYVAAPFVGLFGHRAFAVRFPFALAGLAAVGLVLFWLWRSHAPTRCWVLVAIAWTGNASFYLYCRQARYYALALLATLFVAYFYVRRTARWGAAIGLATAGVALLASQYLAYAAVLVATSLDYALWGRRERPYRLSQVAVIVGLQAAAGGAIVSIWYPLGKAIAGKYAATMPWASERLSLLLLNLRDINSSELAVGFLCLLAPVLYIATQRRCLALLRLPVALFVGVATVALFSPQPGSAKIADVRYLSHLIPGFIVLSALVIDALRLPVWAKVLLALAGLQTTWMQVPLARWTGAPVPPVRSTMLHFAGELVHATEDPYGAAARWIRDHVPTGATVWVLPDFAAYPLMFHAPHAVYAWQFDPEFRSRFPSLPPIHFKGAELPRYIVAFHRDIGEAERVIPDLVPRGGIYARRAVINEYGEIGYRAEVFRHRFERVPFAFDPRLYGIVVWERQ